MLALPFFLIKKKITIEYDTSCEGVRVVLIQEEKLIVFFN
jgi:hypothetical protein